MEHMIAKLLQDFEQGKMSRRQYIQSVALMATAGAAMEAAAQTSAGAAASVKAVSVHHISFDVADYKKVSAFYADVLGMKVWQGTNKNENHARVGDTYLTFRGPGARPGSQSGVTPRVQHIAIAVEPWPGPHQDDVTGNPQLVADLKRRGIPILPGADIKVNDPEGFPVQICGKNWQTDN